MPFLLCIHLIYSFHFKVFSMIFAVPVCLLLLIVVVFYFICLYIVYPVEILIEFVKHFYFYIIVSPVFTYLTV